MWLNPTLLVGLFSWLLAEIYALDLGFKYGLIPVASLFFFYQFLKLTILV